ncbi:helix-turn-helix domain-containing protein [Flavobacterium kingsejongi]|uniref:HTH araC/xylS-type domain-containing protein n=1 Tax=Flavobacterium kingsejongi TaxID=1678728 RepID=A0A2S1LJC3_9FLAO|nr:helix-turn-helix transcriptional regulator [Flavobacterium kingsejongi]AWG23860.1 hypothetical protein FK004_00790 [Flavobacterium kingsejongi]
MFSYQEYYTENKFSLFIKKIWVLDNLFNTNIIAGKSVLPNGCFNIAVIEGNGLKIKHVGWDKHLSTGVYFCGQMTQAIEVDILPNSKATMIQIYPWVPSYFILDDMSNFRDAIILIDSFKFNSELIGKLPGQSHRVIYKTIVFVFAPLFKTGSVPDLIYKATSLIMSNNGILAVSQLATELSCSTRHLQKVFKKHIGLSPKQFSLIIKLRNIIDDIAYPKKEILSITDHALDNEFYDQAHFIHAFKSFAKISPKKFNITDYFLTLKNS